MSISKVVFGAVVKIIEKSLREEGSELVQSQDFVKAYSIFWELVQSSL